MTASGGRVSHPNPYSTGGGGTTLEHRYGAVLMTHLLAGDPIDVLGDDFTPAEISFQAPDEPIDDFVVKGYRGDGPGRRVAISARRDPKIVPSNAASVKLFASFIRFLAKHEKDVATDEWRMALAARTDSVHARQLESLIEIAQDQPDNGAFRAAVERPGRTTQPVRTRLERLDEVVGKALTGVEGRPPSPAEVSGMTFSIVSTLHLHFLALEGASSPDRTTAVARLRDLHPQGTAEAADALFDRLSGLSARYAANQAVIGLTRLQRELGLLMSDGSWERQLGYAQRLRTKISSRRLNRRLSIVGLSEEQVASSFEWDPELPQQLRELQPGDVVSLSGPVGAGKTDTAERWLLGIAEEFDTAAGFSIPAWLRAEDIEGSLEQAVIAELGNAVPPADIDRDVCLVIDGLDERATGADRLALEARVFAATYPRSRILLTTRDGVLSSNFPHVRIPELSNDESQSLISRISGHSSPNISSWPEQLQELVKRPLFAMLAGAQLAENPTGKPAALIRTAAEHAAQGTVDTTTLRKLAVALTNAGKAVDPLIAVPDISEASLKASRLILFEKSRCRFALPVFEQWFAASALMSGLVSVDDVVTDLVAFAKWRYALAACLSSGSREAVDPIMNRIAEWNPGAIGWLVQESLAAGAGSPDGAPVDDWRVEGERIWNATKSLVTGLGTPAAALVRPVRGLAGQTTDPFTKLSLNLDTESRRISQNWRLAVAGRPMITHERLNILDLGDDIIATKRGMPTSDENWLWRWILDDVADDLSSSLQRHLTLLSLPPGGIVAKERATWICREILMSHSDHSGSDTDKVISSIRTAFKQAESLGQRPANLVFRFKTGPDFSGAELESVCGSLERQEMSTEDIWPGPDLEPGGWIWSGYSKERLLERVAAVYEGAVTAYEEIRSGLFAPFGLTLDHAALFPATIVGSLQFSGNEQTLSPPILSYWVRPQATAMDNPGATEITYSESLTLTEAFKLMSTEMEELYSANPESAVFSHVGYEQTVLDLFHRRPATYIALQWLWEDLFHLGWAKGRKPDHHSAK